jgi:hypothetical protein
MQPAMRLPGLPLEQDNSFPGVQLCGWWSIGRECVRTGIYPQRARNLATRVMTEVAQHASHAISPETFATVWRDWKYSRQEETTLQEYVERLYNDPFSREGSGCSDADLMIAAHWLGDLTLQEGMEPASLFTYREGDGGYKRYSLGRVEINIGVEEVDHVRDVILCNRRGIHWTPTRAIDGGNV